MSGPALANPPQPPGTEPPTDLSVPVGIRRTAAALELLAYLLTCACLALAFATPRPLLLAALAFPVFPLARRRGWRASGPAEGLLGLGGLLLGMPLALAERELSPALGLFLLAAQGVKLVAPRTPRDLAVSSLIGVVLTGVAGSEAVEVEFGLLFLLSLACQLAARAARHALVAASQAASPARAAARLGPTARGLAAALATLAVGTSLTFLLIPRYGVKLLPRAKEGGQRLAGFSEVVGLEDIGRIKQNSAVAFRADLRGWNPGQELYWRGVALELYDGSRWRAGRLSPDHLRLDRTGAGTFVDRLLAPPPEEATREVAVYLQPLGTDCLFTLGSVREVRFAGAVPLRLARDLLGTWRLGAPPGDTTVYRLTLYPSGRGALGLPPPVQRRLLERCLLLPDRVDRPRLERYLRQVLRRQGLAPGAGMLETARALEAHLQENFRYSLAGESTEGAEPVADFLFRRRSGHCEVFASALAVLLRVVGIPARLVTGFRGGQADPLSGAWIVRQREAHAWVEAWTGAHWERFDPTPPDASAAAAAGEDSALRSLGEWIELRWYQYVIAYDAYDQSLSLFILVRWLRGLFGLEQPDEAGEAAGAGESWTARRALAASALLLGVGLGVRVLRRRRARRAAWPVPPALAPLLGVLASRGLRRGPGETPRELLARGGQLPGGGERLERFLARYEASRFGGALDPEGQLLREGAELARDLRPGAGLDEARPGA